MRVNKSKAFFVLAVAGIFTPLSYGFSLYFLDLYTGGDQFFYHRFYDAVSGVGPLDVMNIQLAYTGSVEPLYGLLSWLGASLMPKNEWISIFNALLFVSIIAYLKKSNVSLFLYPLVLTNYYLFVIAFSAERLKFAVLVILISVQVSKKWRYPVGALALLFHFQSIFFISGVAGKKMSDALTAIYNKRISISTVLGVGVTILALGIVWHYFSQTLLAKINHYQVNGFEGLFKFMILAFSAMLVSPQKSQTFYTFIILAVATFVFGGTRMNMVSFMYAIHYSFSWKRGLNPITLGLLIYFSERGFVFLYNIATLGDGFGQNPF